MSLNLSGTSGIAGAGIGTIDASGANVTGIVTATDGIIISGDNKRLKFGVGDDLNLYSTGTNGWVYTPQSGADLYMGTNAGEVYIQTGTSGNDTAIKVNSGAAVELNYGTSKKLETTSDGIFVKNSIKLEEASGSEYYLIATNSYGGLEFQNETTKIAEFTDASTLELQDNLKFAVSGKGIDFSAAGGSNAGATSSILDDYEEGTFTPTLGFASNTNNDWTYNAQQGTYIKVGNLCHFVIRIEINAMGSGNNGWIEINNLPFAMYDMMSGISYEGTTNVDFHDAKINVSGPRALYDADSSGLKLIDTDAGPSFFNASRALLKDTVLQTNTDIRVRGTYRTT